MEAEIVQRFLESVGAKADIDLYLRLHRAQRKESFAMLAPNAQIVKSALDPLHFDLRILAGLGLLPVVVLGLLEPKDADAQATRVSDWLLEDDVPCDVVRATARRDASRADDGRRDPRHRRARRDPAGVAGGDQGADAPRRASACSRRWPPRSRRARSCSSAGGRAWRPNGGPILPVVSLATDTQRLLAPGALPRGQAMLLRQVKQVVESVPQRLSVTVVNPLQLLRELFTVNGAGTLIRRGSRIDVHTTLGRHRSRAHRGAVRVGVRARRCAPTSSRSRWRASSSRRTTRARRSCRRRPSRPT